MKYATKSNTDPTSKHKAARSKASTVVTHGPEAIAQRKMAHAVSNSPHMVTQREMAASIHQSPQLTALRDSSNALPVQREADSAAATNTTGLPDGLKAGIEAMSGISMDNVNVHYNSDKPAQLQALAHTQGTDIHVAPGQEKHLPHEAWHVVQQAQGRVKATMQMKGVGVNDDAALEHEADVMGAKAASFSAQSQMAPETREVAHGAAAPVQRVPDMAQIAAPELKPMLKFMEKRNEEGADTSKGGHSMIHDLAAIFAHKLNLRNDKAPAFWSGRGALAAAQNDPNVFTLEALSLGQAAQNVVKGFDLHGDESLEIWNEVSEALAHAVGMTYGKNGLKSSQTVYAFISTAAKTGSVWKTKEKPILEAYGVTIKEVSVPAPPIPSGSP